MIARNQLFQHVLDPQSGVAPDVPRPVSALGRMRVAADLAGLLTLVVSVAAYVLSRL